MPWSNPMKTSMRDCKLWSPIQDVVRIDEGTLKFEALLLALRYLSQFVLVLCLLIYVWRHRRLLYYALEFRAQCQKLIKKAGRRRCDERECGKISGGPESEKQVSKLQQKWWLFMQPLGIVYRDPKLSVYTKVQWVSVQFTFGSCVR